jgi:glycolate oxidase FAD binding subunit
MPTKRGHGTQSESAKDVFLATITETLPITETLTPADLPGVRQIVRDASESKTAMYPIGGGTSLDFGLTARRTGLGLSLANLNRIIDYPARDMTITVEAGITMSELARTLSAERQWLPIEVPQPEQATLGGVIATAWSGPRRFAYGTMRDYVIGISAVDGRGMAFKAGGRVVKNVAGYDFCKLLTGSLGTLAVITQITLKIKPVPESFALVSCAVPTLSHAERLLAALVNSETTPSAVELLIGEFWQQAPGALDRAAKPVGHLVVGLEGTKAEVDWMIDRLTSEWQTQGVNDTQAFRDAAADELWVKLRDFPTAGEAPLVVKVSVLPSRVTDFCYQVQLLDPRASMQAHAGNGIVIVRFSSFAADQVSRGLIGRLQPAARASGGSLIVLSSSGLGDLTRQATWGGAEPSHEWMTKIKRQFDPHGLLNPGRFIYA